MDAEVFTERFQLGGDVPERDRDAQRAAALSVGLPVFQSRFEACKERIWRHSQRDQSSWVVRRWSVYDLSKFATAIDMIKCSLDALEGITSCLGILEEQKRLLRHEIELVTDEARLRLLNQVSSLDESSPVLSVVSNVVNSALRSFAEPKGPKTCPVYQMHQTKLGVTSLVEETSISGTQKKGSSIQVTSISSRSGERKDNPGTGLSEQADLCQACRIITLPMLVNGFRHPLDFEEVQKSKDHCRFCALLGDAYNTQTCINQMNLPCDKIHRDRLQWALEALGPGVRYGMFKLDSGHYGRPIRIYSLEGMFLVSWPVKISSSSFPYSLMG